MESSGRKNITLKTCSSCNTSVMWLTYRQVSVGRHKILSKEYILIRPWCNYLIEDLEGSSGAQKLKDSIFKQQHAVYPWTSDIQPSLECRVTRQIKLKPPVLAIYPQVWLHILTPLLSLMLILRTRHPSSTSLKRPLSAATCRGVI